MRRLLVLHLLLLPAALGAFGAAAASAACMKGNVPASAQGRLTIGHFKDGMGRPETAFILRVSAPACFDSDDKDERVKSTRTIHVYSANDAVQKTMTRLVGKSVEVSGNPFPQMTVHHHAPIVMEVTKIGAH